MKQFQCENSRSKTPLSASRWRLLCLIIAGSLATAGLGLAILFLEGDSGDILGIQSVVAQSILMPGSLAPAKTVSSTSAYTNCRFGIGQVHHPVTTYPNFSTLNAGHYLNWHVQTNPLQPGGIEYIQVLRVSDGAAYGGREHPGPISYTPSGGTLEAAIAANPGALWLVGNEPDCIWQDNVLPQNYAQIYHDAYTFIKGHDPGARVAVGGIVQPTPLRMAYLDTVLSTYFALYDTPLPTDAWYIHSFILREVNCSVYPDSCWGCEIPPGATAAHGMLYELEQTDNLNIFEQRIIQFRQWMRNHGYQDKPLLITEYGTLMPHQYEGWDEERGRVFMHGTFDFLLSADDTSLGYRADENRLVQQWTWYSLDDSSYGGTLFDRITLDLLPMGTYFGDYTSELSPTVDLFAVDVGQVGPVPHSPTETVTITLRARVSNVGNTPATQPVNVRFFDDTDVQIGSDQVVSETIAGCAQMQTITMTWTDVPPGAHSVRVVVDPTAQINEGNEDNNEALGIVLVAETKTLLPLVAR